VSTFSALAQFLRARRAQVRPEHVGLLGGNRRRVEGLRREEVAYLAGISVDYYVRIEQGRETNPSDEVLDRIAHALNLGDDGATYVRDLVRTPRLVHRRAATQINPAIDWLISGWPLSPAQIHDGALNVVSANPLALAVSPQFGPGINTLRALFLDPEMQTFYRNWDKLTAWAVSWVRAYSGHNPNPSLAEVVDELSAKSQLFRSLWSHHDIRHDSTGVMEIVHPNVGPMALNYQHLTLPGTDHVLVVYWARPGSNSEKALQMLRRAQS
jgi:transcriptional regulator with XRE-family HTH domain